MANRWGNSGNSDRLYLWGAPKSFQMVIAALKLKDTYSLEGKLLPALIVYWKEKKYYFTNKGPSIQGNGFSSGHVWMWELDCEESWVLKNWWFCTVVLEKTLEGPLDCKEIQSVRRSVLGVHWKDWCWSWNSNTLTTSCEELTHWNRLWCWEGLGAGGEGDDRGWDGWMASLTQWTWVWVNSRSWWWTGRPRVLWFMGSQRVEHDWVTELNLCFQTYQDYLVYISGWFTFLWTQCI